MKMSTIAAFSFGAFLMMAGQGTEAMHLIPVHDHIHIPVVQGGYDAKDDIYRENLYPGQHFYYVIDHRVLGVHAYQGSHTVFPDAYPIYVYPRVLKGYHTHR